MIEIAEYADRVIDQVAESTFMQGIQPDFAIAIRSTPVPLNLGQKVEFAQRY